MYSIIKMKTWTLSLALFILVLSFPQERVALYAAVGPQSKADSRTDSKIGSKNGAKADSRAAKKINKKSKSSSFVPPEPWEIKRALEIYAAEKPKKFRRLLSLKKRSIGEFIAITKKIVIRQRWKDFHARKKKKKTASFKQNKKKIRQLARQYYTAPTILHKKLIEKKLDEVIEDQLKIRREQKELRLERLRARLDKLEEKWDLENTPEQAPYIKHQVLKNAVRQISRERKQSLKKR